MAGNRAGALKGVETRRRKYGDKIISWNARKGGEKSTRGYFGKLKDEGRYDEIKHYSKKAVETRKRNKKDYSEEVW